DHIQTEMPDSLHDGVAIPQEHFPISGDTHQIAPRGKQVRGGRGTRGRGSGRGQRGAYICSPHTQNVSYMSTHSIPYVGGHYVPYMDSSSSRFTTEPFTNTQPSFMEQLL
ncbi:hypothetical protein MKX03_031290, partial [Papaver bracteatum]